MRLVDKHPEKSVLMEKTMNSEPSNNAGPAAEKLPSEQRTVLIEEFVEMIAAALRSRAEEVLESPQDFGGNDPFELRWQICGAIADDLHHYFGDHFEGMLEEALKNPGKKTDCARCGGTVYEADQSQLTRIKN